MKARKKLLIRLYSRKSKYTQKGDSVENQVEMDMAYIREHYPEDEYDVEVIIYEDDGWSGGTIDRPKFIKMIRENRKRPADILICYRLDRISRSISDFSSLIDELSKLGTAFVSIKEQFDTSTPMGRAMMYIASVFAQLEREVIAERIRDNMIELAKTGRWLGGTTPTGYESVSYELVKVIDDETGESKTKEAHKLEQISEEGKIIQLIFRKYLELMSFKKVDEYLLKKHINTKNGVPHTITSIRDIIINPVYAVNDEDMYNYFEKNNVEVFNSKGIESFDGKHGIMGYGKNNLLNLKPGRKKPMDEWIVAIGGHKGYISGKDWVRAQEIKAGNFDIRSRVPVRNKSILSGIYRCECCGDYMRPKLRTGRYTQDGKEVFTYMCRMKDRSKKKRCNGENTSGILLDELVIKEIKKIIAPNNKIYNALKKMSIANNDEDDVEYELQNLKEQYNKNQQEIKNLVEKIKYIDVSFMEEINKEIVRLKEASNRLEKEIKQAEKENNTKRSKTTKSDTASIVLDIMNNYINTFEDLNVAEQRGLLKLLIEKMTGNGNKVTIDLLNTNLKDEQKHLKHLVCDDEILTDTQKKHFQP